MNSKLVADALRLLADAIEADDCGSTTTTDEPKAEEKAKAPPRRKAPAKKQAKEAEPEVTNQDVTNQDVINILQQVIAEHGKSAMREILDSLQVQRVGELDATGRAEAVKLAQEKLDSEED